MSNAAPYREDLDTLRALAIGLVLLSSFDLIGGLSGGFLGVDIFFVVTGYAITRQHLPAALEGRFSICDFWAARLRRLVPALSLLLLSTLAVAWLYDLPSQLVTLAKQTLAAQVFVSNQYPGQTVDHLATQPGHALLQHTWPLAVAVQFYLLYALLLLAGKRMGARGFFVGVGLLTAVSFGLCLSLVDVGLQAGAYLLPTRLWELGAGCLLAVAQWHRQSTSVVPPVPAAGPGSSWAFLGWLALTLGSVVAFGGAMRTPGPHSLLPVIGTLGLIAWGPSLHGAMRRAWLIAPLRYLGRISYPVFLAHWPIHVLGQDLLRQDYTWEVRVGCTLLTLLVAMAIHEWLHRPIAARKDWTCRRTLLGFVAITLAIGTMCAAIIRAQGFPQRFSGPVLGALNGENDRPADLLACPPDGQPRQIAPVDKRCQLGDLSLEPRMVLLGDSHAWALQQPVSDALRSRHKGGRLIFLRRCPPILGVHLQDGGRDACHQHNAKALDWVIQNPRVDSIILVSAWIQGAQSLTDNPLVAPTAAQSQALFREGLLQTVQALKKAGKKVYLVGPVPGARHAVPLTMARNLRAGKPPSLGLGLSWQEHRERFAFFFDPLPSVQAWVDGYFDPASALCQEGACQVEIAGKPLYFDHEHLSNAGSQQVEPGIRMMLGGD